MPISRLEVSLEKDLLKAIDIDATDNNFANQSQTVRHLCLVIIAIKGKANRLTELSDKLIFIKGIKHGKLVMNKTD